MEDRTSRISTGETVEKTVMLPLGDDPAPRSDRTVTRTIVIPRDDRPAPRVESVERTVVIPAGDDPAPRQEKPLTRTVQLPRANASGRQTDPAAANDGSSFFTDLENLLFPNRRTVVEETIGMEESDQEVSADIDGSASSVPLADVRQHYSVAEKPFAAGGQGKISKAVDLSLGCEVALKSLHDKLCSDEHARASFLREAKLTAALDHPSIIPIHGLFGDDANGMHLAMKLISGHTLNAYLRTIIRTYEEKGVRRFNERKSLRNRIEIFLKICEAVEYAHERGILHRDLKLENIMIGKHRETYVTDWGLGMSLREAEHLKVVNGTPAFLAPEVLTRRSADTRSDIYALGIILFELVTLTPAFAEKDLKTLLAQVKEGRHAPLRHRFKCRIDADLQAIIRKAIDVDPEKRYRKVEDLSEDLRRYLTNDETSARPDHFFGKICRWGVKHRRGMLLATMTVLLLGITGIARTLHREIRWSTEKRFRDQAVGVAYGNTVTTANKLEKSLESIEYRLEQLRMNLLFSALKVEMPHDSKCSARFVPIKKYLTDPPPGFLYSESYRHKIDPDTLCVFNYLPGKEINPSLPHYYANTAHFMRDALLDVRGLSKAEAKERLLKVGRPIKKLYFVLEDGTFACAPGSPSDFPDGYFPPERIWYRNAEAAPGRRVWSGPYEDSGIHKESMLTCSTRIDGAGGKPIGIAAIDFSLTQLARQMLKSETGAASFLREKMLINPKGEVIFRMTPPERENSPSFSDQRMIRQMLRMKFGTLLTHAQDREVLLAFTWLDSINVLYAEALDMEMLVDRQREKAAAGQEETETATAAQPERR